MPGRAVTSLSDREIAELRAVPDVKSAGEAKAGSPAGRGNSTTVPDSGGPPSPTAGRRRKAPAQSPPEGSLSMFSGAVSRPKRPSGELPAQQQPGVEPDLPASQVFGFGYNGHGQLGCGDTRAHAAPQLLRELVSIALTSLACGSGHSVAIDAAGGAHAWGDGASGQLGTGDREPRLLLSHVESCAMYMVVCGLMHTLALDLLGCVWVCGKSGLGCVCMGESNDGGSGERQHGRPATCCAGMGDDAMGVIFSDSVCVLQPVEGLSDVVFVTAGVRICMTVDSVGTAFEWGSPRSRASEELWWPGSTDARVIHTYVPEPRAVAVPARVGRYNLRLGPLFALALAMGGHKRLGEKSWLYMPSTDVLRKIAEACLVRDPANLKENE